MSLQGGQKSEFPNSNFAVQKFNFRPESDDVGKKLVVEKVIIGMGQSNSGIKMNLHQIIPEEKFGRPPYEKDFPSFRARKLFRPLLNYVST